MTTKIKICGITDLDDALAAASLGAYAVGFNFFPSSPRYILPEAAREIADALPDIIKIGVFVNEKPENIAPIVAAAALDQIQLHGDEDAAFIRCLRDLTPAPIIKAVRVGPDLSLDDMPELEPDLFLLDTFSADAYGGTGRRFDWKLARTLNDRFGPIFLAGGISPENICQAIEEVRPFAVDVCSSIESSPGRKDHEKMKRLFRNAK